MSAANTIPVSDELYREVAERAEQIGVSPQAWVTAALETRVRLERQTEEFFRRRASGSSLLPLGKLLDKAPTRTPDPGDELES